MHHMPHNPIPKGTKTIRDSKSIKIMILVSIAYDELGQLDKGKPDRKRVL